MIFNRLSHRSVICLLAAIAIGEGASLAQSGPLLSGKMGALEKRADQGYTREEMELAEAYMTGKGVPKDYSRAAYWYEKAAQNGLPEAEHQIAYLYSFGLGVPRDLERARHWYQLASASGVPMAKINLGVMYLDGRGVDRDVPRAKQLFQEAAEKGQGIGAAYLGVLELTGVGGAPDKAAAEKWFERGVKLHDPVAAFALATMYLDFDDHSHDIRKTISLLRFASEKGYVDAKLSLGSLLLKQPQFAHSDNEPMELIGQASDAGDWHATELLGVLALKGHAAAPDPPKALYYFHLTELQGGDAARQRLHAMIQSIEQDLSPEERARQADQAEAWYEQHRLTLVFVARPDFVIPAIQDSARILGSSVAASK